MDPVDIESVKVVVNKSQEEFVFIFSFTVVSRIVHNLCRILFVTNLVAFVVIPCIL